MLLSDEEAWGWQPCEAGLTHGLVRCWSQKLLRMMLNLMLKMMMLKMIILSVECAFRVPLLSAHSGPTAAPYFSPYVPQSYFYMCRSICFY